MKVFSDVFRNALNKMLGGDTEEYPTVTVNACDIRINDRFVDVNGAVYTVSRKKENRGVICVYAETGTGNADGWFTRESYNVIKEDLGGYV